MVSYKIQTKVKIGIPGAMMYFEHGRLWEGFFKALGLNVIVSPPTNKIIVERGLSHCSNETCLPVKVFHGHVMYLKDKADYIFIPRYVSMAKNSFCCPKLCALPDMASLNLKNSVNILELKVDFHNGILPLRQSLETIANTLDLDFLSVQKAYYETIGLYLENRISDTPAKHDLLPAKSCSVAVLGHPYVIYDNHISMDLIDKLIKRNISVFTPFDNQRAATDLNCQPFLGKVFWDIGYSLMGNANIFIKNPEIDALIYLSPFACGIDSVITEFIERNIKQCKNKHFMKLTIDEHTGEAGFDTRLDAFLDMLDYSKIKTADFVKSRQ